MGLSMFKSYHHLTQMTRHVRIFFGHLEWRRGWSTPHITQGISVQKMWPMYFLGLKFAPSFLVGGLYVEEKVTRVAH